MGIDLRILIEICDWMGIVVFAISGALLACQRRMDAFGVVVLGCVTAIGGGTMRDVILGAYPVVWIAQPAYLGVAALTALLIFLVCHRMRLPHSLLLYADALGLAVFTIIGFEKTFRMGAGILAAIVMGIVTATGGGLLRDILAQQTPLILQREIYATASLAGGVFLAAALAFQCPIEPALAAALVVTLAIRVASIHWDLSLPVRHEKIKS